VSQLERLLEQMQREIDNLQKQIEVLQSSEYNRMNIMFLTDGVDAPSAVSGWAIMFVDKSDGDLKIIFSDGTTKTITADT